MKNHWEQYENLMRIVLTSWELIENLLRTHWEQEENENPLLHLHSLQTQKIYWGHVEPSHWLHAIFMFEIVGHRFWPRLMAATKKTMG